MAQRMKLTPEQRSAIAKKTAEGRLDIESFNRILSDALEAIQVHDIDGARVAPRGSPKSGQ
jgi:hypothetical protein